MKPIMKSSRNDRSGRSAINLACIALLTALLACIALPALGQRGSSAERAVAEGTAVETADDVRSRLEALEKVTDLDAALKEKLQELYGGALRRLGDANASADKEVRFRGMIDTAPARIQEIGETLSQFTQSPPGSISIEETLPSADLDQQLAKEQAELAALKSRLDKFTDKLSELNNRPVAAKEQLEVAKQKVDEITAKLKALTPSDEPELLTEARQLNRRARLRARQAEIAMLEQEILTYEIRLKLTEAERELAQEEHARAEKRVTVLEAELKQRLRLTAWQIERETELAERKAAGKHPVLQRVAERNAELSHAVSEIVKDLEKFVVRRAEIAEQMKQIEADLQRARKGLEIAGMSLGVGRFLRSRQRALPEMRGYDRATARRAARTAEIGFQTFQVIEALDDLGTVETTVERIMADDVGQDLSTEQRQVIEGELNELLVKQMAILKELQGDYTTSMLRLGELDFDERQLVEKAETYAKFLDERLMWIPTAPPPSGTTLTKLADATGWLLSPAAWAETLQTLVRKVRQEVATSLIFVIAFGLLIWFRGRAREKIKDLNSRVGKPSTDRFGITLAAFVCVFLLAAPLPLLVLYVGWLLESALSAPEFTRAVGFGLLTAGTALLILQFFHVFLDPDGVARIHLRWKEPALRLLKANLAWLTPILIPLAFLVDMFGIQTEPTYNDSLGRLAFLLLLTLIIVFAYRVLNPFRESPVWRLAGTERGWIWRLRRLWFVGLVGLPFGLIVLAVTGYYYAARHLNDPVTYTALLAVSIVIVQNLMIRWLGLAQMKLAYRKARAKREAEKKLGEDVPEGAPLMFEEPDVDLATIGRQSRELIYSAVGLGILIGLWVVWAPVLPAWRFIGEFPLWQISTIVNGEEILTSITAGDVALAGLIGTVVAVATRNLPGVLEIALLQRLQLPPGIDYAITKLAQYILIFVGVLVVTSRLGLAWSNLQWLVAALGVGLGFGLQEIFANFVSGLIILFERPIRVGDTVTVEGVSGTVTRIRIRATTITDWDNKEVVVPNKTFITNQLTNWTLSDPITRLTFTVAIAYGSDTRLAQQIMLNLAKSNPLVLDDPEPSVYFMGFGDSSLDFTVRVFVKDYTDLWPVSHALHVEIDDALREVGIEIPFPQRDIHVRTRTSQETAAPEEGITPISVEKPRRKEQAGGKVRSYRDIDSADG